jgi:hypothetical protein
MNRIALALLALGTTAAAQTLDVPLGPQDGYLRLSPGDSAVDATPLALSALGAVPGQSLLLAGFGDMDNGPASDSILSLIGVYSSSPVLLATSLQHRVPGALEAGPEFVSSPTLSGSLPTDIPEDFRVTSASQADATVEIPAGAQFLFVGNHDSQWFDNSDPDGDLGCKVTVVATWKDVGLALPGTAGPPTLAGSGHLIGGDAMALTLDDARPNASAFLIVGFSGLVAPFKGGTLVPNPDLILGPFPTGAGGGFTLPGTWPVGLPELLKLWFQAWIQDPVGPAGFAASNGLTCLTP